MKKFYTALFLFFVPGTMLFAQCPIIRGAVINGCGTEGLNELVLFTTTAEATAGDYTLYYGSTNPPTSITPQPSGLLPGSNATTKNGTGTIISLGGCTIVYVTSPSTVIPASSAVIFIPSNFTNNFTIATCPSGNVYVVLIDITASPSIWMDNGTLSNNPGAATFRYLQVINGTSNCTSEVRSYASGWAGGNAEGNAVAWDDLGTPVYASLGCSIIALPVKLASFNAVGAGKNANIAWQTATETNSGSFELQRSTDGAKFDAIATIAATGSSGNYGYTDVNIPGTSYYRLKIIDKDGSVTYSQIIKVSGATGKFVVTNTYPKPATSQLTITWNSPAAGKTMASVYDYTGKLLMSQELSTLTGMNSAQLQVSKLPKGQYLLKLSKDNDTEVTRFTK